MKRVLNYVALRQKYDVRDYGARGNGSASDWQAVGDAATAAVQAGGGWLYFPEAPTQWIIDAPIAISPPSGSIAYLNIEAAGRAGDIGYTGSSDTAIFSMTGWKYSSVRNLKINLLNAQNDVTVFDILGTASYPSSGSLDWTNCLFGLGTGKSCRGIRFGRDLGNRGIDSVHLLNVVFDGQGANTLGHVGVQNLSSDMLTNKFTKCASSDLSIAYSGSSWKTRLNGAIDATVQTITLRDAVPMASQGRVRIDSEEIAYTGRTATQLTGCTRGVNGTTAAIHVDNAITDEGIKKPDGTFGYDVVGGGAHVWDVQSGTNNRLEWLFRSPDTYTIIGPRLEGVTRVFQAAFQQSTGMTVGLYDAKIAVNVQPADNILFAIGAPGRYFMPGLVVSGADQTAAMISANGYDSWGAPSGNFGSIHVPASTIRMAAAAVPVTQPATWQSPVVTGSVSTNSASQPQGYLLPAQTYAATNVTTDRTFDANATTLDEVADVLGTLLSDLRARGMVA